MKRLMTGIGLAAAVALSAGPAQADSIKGKLAISGNLGFTIPADNEADFFHNNTDTGVVLGGGLLYGLDRNIAGEFEVRRSWFGSEIGDFGVTDISLGGQYRFAGTRELTPYLGAGLDILVSDFDPDFGPRQDVDTTVGVHLKGGVDYFVTRQLALTAEARLVLAPDADVTDRSGARTGSFDPTSFSGSVGIRYFFP
jgi:outer membrane protein